LKEEGAALAGLHAGGFLQIEAKIAFRHLFFIGLVREGAERANQKTGAATDAGFSPVNDLSMAFLSDQAARNTGFHTGSGKAMLASCGPGGVSAHLHPDPLPRSLLPWKPPHVRDPEASELAGQHAALAKKTALGSEENPSIHKRSFASPISTHEGSLP
jgi:hypothetical protein